MKTIKEAAADYAEETKDQTNGMFYADCQEAFNAGAAHIQRWIPTTEELPEKNFTEYGLQFGIGLLIKMKNDRVVIGDRRWSEDHQDFKWRYRDGSRIYGVVAWRQIDTI